MGYYINQEDAKFNIKSSNVPKALAAIKALHGDESIEDVSGRHFSWVSANFF